jgi:hypothetical protein
MKRSIILLNLLISSFVFAEEPICKKNSDCSEMEYCKKSLGDCEGDGQCVQKSEICTMEYKPVCGCDKNTYSNLCSSESKGISVLSDGECH